MIARLIISTSLKSRLDEINDSLTTANLTISHPDVLYFPADSKLGIMEARKVKEHFSLKPYSAKGRVVVLEDASKLTPDAQNALLKTLEELPEEGIIILGADSESKFLPTVLSRCQIEILTTNYEQRTTNFSEDIERLLTSSIGDRFEYIEKLKDRQEFLKALLNYFHQKLPVYNDFTKELLQAEEWAKSNVNIRGILEYLMLVMPK